MSNDVDNVSPIHRRYFLTLLYPSSLYQSLAYSIIISSILVATFVFVNPDYGELFPTLFFVIAALIGTQFIDSRFIKRKEYSKALHLSFFGNLLWLVVILVALASDWIFSTTQDLLFYTTEGMFLFTSIRIGLFTTTLGLSIPKALVIGFIQPLAMFFVLIPSGLWNEAIIDPQTIGFGITFVAMTSVWSYLTDRAGRPEVKSTHQSIQAYLYSLKPGGTHEAESIIESHSKPQEIFTMQIKLQPKGNGKEFRLVLPDVHPGPFHPIGGSNIPYEIYKKMNSSAMVMHSISDHSLNLPSKKEVENYLNSLNSDVILENGAMCTEPVTVQINKSRVTGLLFGKTVILLLSLSPHGMEDIPIHVRNEIENLSKIRNFEHTMLVDCHNAMGETISEIDSKKLLDAAKTCLDNLMKSKQYPVKFGYANSKDMNVKSIDLGMGGIGILCLEINEKSYFVGWADSNNMENGVREDIVNYFSKHGLNLLEICTSDTHFTSGTKNRNGYYQFGKIASPQKISQWYLEIAQQAKKTIEPAIFEILKNKSNVKVMGTQIFDAYSRAVDKTIKLSKGFLLGGFILFLISII